MLATMRVREDKMRAAMDGYLNATDLADYLVGRGVPFRDAHAAAGRAVLHALREGKRLEELPFDVLQNLCGPVGEDVFTVLDVRRCVASRRSTGGTAPSAVEEGLARAKALLAQESP